MKCYTYIAHHGIKGMRWGFRRYQNEDGSLTSAGRLRYDVGIRALKSAGRFGLALGKAKTEHYRSKASDQVRSLKNQVRRRSRSVQMANLRGQRDYYQKKAKGRSFIESLAKKKEQIQRQTFMQSDSRFRSRINVGARYVQRMASWEDMMANPRPIDKSWIKALPDRVTASRTFASIDWKR